MVPLESARDEQRQPGGLSRRYFFETVGCAAMGVVALGGGVLSWEFLIPNVLFEPPNRFKVGAPADYPPGSVSLLAASRIFIVREKKGYFYALSAVCTHLGCITAWKAGEGIIACPCHGSKFARTGERIAGPAPRSLPRLLITLEDGLLVVDRSVVVSAEQILKV